MKKQLQKPPKSRRAKETPGFNTKVPTSQLNQSQSEQEVKIYSNPNDVTMGKVSPLREPARPMSDVNSKPGLQHLDSQTIFGNYTSNYPVLSTQASKSRVAYASSKDSKKSFSSFSVDRQKESRTQFSHKTPTSIAPQQRKSRKFWMESLQSMKEESGSSQRR